MENCQLLHTSSELHHLGHNTTVTRWHLPLKNKYRSFLSTDITTYSDVFLSRIGSIEQLWAEKVGWDVILDVDGALLHGQYTLCHSYN